MMLVKKLLIGALVLLCRPAAAYVRPGWFDRIEAEDQSDLLQRWVQETHEEERYPIQRW